MDNYILLINTILLCAAWMMLYYHPVRKALHMFQQNRYELRRYLPWLKGDLDYRGRRTRLSWLSIAVGIVLAIASRWLPIIAPSVAVGLIMAYSLFLTYQSKSLTSIKPLVFTARVKRQVVVMGVLLILSCVVLLQAGWFWMILFTPLILEGMGFYILPMALITMPLEAVIKRRYIGIAKHILRQHPSLIKVGITGSYGKTSSKNILNEVLSERYYVLSTPASFNTPMGLTLTIREQLKSVHQVFIAEMGADKVGEIQFLSRFIQPQYGIVTSIGPQHLNTFKTLDNIIREKMSLIENLPVHGVGILNNDNEYIRTYSIQNSCKIVRYGIDTAADYQAVDIQYSPTGSHFKVLHENQTHEFSTRLLGKHNIANILGAIALGRELKLSWEQLQHAVKQVNYIEHRLQLKKINGFNYIDNAFNSNPEGSKMSLEVLSRMPGHRTIITPGMIDLGHQQDAYNKAFGAMMKGQVDTVILVGQQQTQAIRQGLVESGFDMDQVIVVDHVKQAFQYIESHARLGDITLLENDLPDAFSR